MGGSLLSQSRVAASPQMAFGASRSASTTKKVVAKKVVAKKVVAKKVVAKKVVAKKPDGGGGGLFGLGTGSPKKPARKVVVKKPTPVKRVAFRAQGAVKTESLGILSRLSNPMPDFGKGLTGTRKDFDRVSYDKRPKGLKAGVGMAGKNPKSKKINPNDPRTWSR